MIKYITSIKHIIVQNHQFCFYFMYEKQYMFHHIPVQNYFHFRQKIWINLELLHYLSETTVKNVTSHYKVIAVFHIGTKKKKTDPGIRIRDLHSELSLDLSPPQILNFLHKSVSLNFKWVWNQSFFYFNWLRFHIYSHVNS